MFRTPPRLLESDERLRELERKTRESPDDARAVDAYLNELNRRGLDQEFVDAAQRFKREKAFPIPFRDAVAKLLRAHDPKGEAQDNLRWTFGDAMRAAPYKVEIVKKSPPHEWSGMGGAGHVEQWLVKREDDVYYIISQNTGLRETLIFHSDAKGGRPYGSFETGSAHDLEDGVTRAGWALPHWADTHAR